jgi:hypothetical protein
MRQEDDDNCPWMDHVIGFANGMPGEAQALGHYGGWDSLYNGATWWMPDGQYPAVSLVHQVEACARLTYRLISEPHSFQRAKCSSGPDMRTGPI